MTSNGLLVLVGLCCSCSSTEYIGPSKKYIYTRSVPKAQAALSNKVMAAEAEDVHKELLQRSDLRGAARFKDSWQPGALAWLHASRKDPKQCIPNAEFRLAVGNVLSINGFPDVPSATPCPGCKSPIGEDLGGHLLCCKQTRTGNDNRSHNAGQSALVMLLREAGANVITTPGISAWSGAAPSKPKYNRCMFDIGVRNLDDGPDFAIDLTISDCGLGKRVTAAYKTGATAKQRGLQKRKVYKKRHPTLADDSWYVPSYGRSGSKNAEAVSLQKRITKALAAVVKTVPYSVIAACVSRRLSVALQRSVALSTLDYYHTKLAGSQRAVGAGVHVLAPAQVLEPLPEEDGESVFSEDSEVSVDDSAQVLPVSGMPVAPKALALAVGPLPNIGDVLVLDVDANDV